MEEKKSKDVKDNMLTGSEELSDAKPLTIDEAKRRLKLSGDKADAFEKRVLERQDGQFTKIMSIIFGWKLQNDGSQKLVSKMPSGKILFVDKSENLDEVEAGMPYICLVYDRPNEYNDKGELVKEGREAFAKIICKEYEPKIFIQENKLSVMVWTDDSGNVRNKIPVANSHPERLMELINLAEKYGWPSLKIVFRGNQHKHKVK